MSELLELAGLCAFAAAAYVLFHLAGLLVAAGVILILLGLALDGATFRFPRMWRWRR